MGDDCALLRVPPSQQLAVSIDSLVAGFALFRLFDIWKPWPIRWLDRTIPGGLGIMVDDLAARAMAWVVLQLAVLWLP